jgi:hypothetical protein
MNGERGDQPMVIVPFQSGIQQDLPGGHFTIGSYLINNGNGRTIRDDIAPSTTELSNTNYYALVTTDTDGRAVVTFQTSTATSTKTFSIKVENSRSAANSDILIERGLLKRVPTTIRKDTPIITPIPTTTTALVRTEDITSNPIFSTTTPQKTPIPPQRAVLEFGYSVIAMISCIILLCNKDFSSNTFQE